MEKRIVVLLFTLAAQCLNIAAQDKSGFVTDFTTEGERRLLPGGIMYCGGPRSYNTRGNQTN
jgi:hypothetical protein